MPGEVFTKAEIAALAALRTRFLDGTNVGGGYWRSEEELALYDTSFGERIGWKWDTVIAELRERGWQPRSRHVVDWGCGSGIAGRRVLGAWDGFESLAVTDVSALAMRFAEARARAAFAQVRVRTASPSDRLPAGALLLVSHVVNELDDRARTQLLAAVRQADEVIWIEAGTHADSRRLIAVREEIRGEFEVVAPCTHQGRCGMLAAENAQHWCHHFGRAPAEASRDARWAQFGRELRIDLRSLPCSFLVLQRRRGSVSIAGCSRIIGRPREAKGRMEILSCGADGVEELMLQQRDVPGLFKDLRKGRAGALHRWTLDGRRIVDATPPEM
jgi:ribosomal protein RSM22 (predicted rRNA methylase)